MRAYEPHPDPVQEMIEAPHTERIPHPARTTIDGASVVAVFRTTQLCPDETTYILITDAGDTVYTTWQGERCSRCDDNETYTPGRGTPSSTAQQERTRANCTHANISADAFHLSSTGACQDCGGWAIDTREIAHPHVPGAVAMVEEYCDDCGTRR